jgi:large exoprotein involved in heme utilization and adhesion
LRTSKEGDGLLRIAAGTVNVLNNSQIQVNNNDLSNADVNSGIQIAANNILIDNSTLVSNASSDGNGADITIKTPNGQLALHNNASIKSNTTAGGNNGNIKIDSDIVELDNNSLISITNERTATNDEAGVIEVNSKTLNILNKSVISSNTKSFAAAGAIKINGDNLNIVNESQIKSGTDATGNTGNVTVTVKQVSIDGQNKGDFSGIFSDVNLRATGHGGFVKINSDDIKLINEGTIRSRTQSSNVTGKAGDVIINAKSLLLDSAGRISSDTNLNSNANAGNIQIKTDKLTILEQGDITSNTYSTGNAGKIDILANQILIDGKNSPADTETKISTNATENSTGDAGTVTVTATDLRILDGGTISSSTKGHSQGNAGEVTINANNITIDGKGNPQYTGIFSDSYANFDNSGVDLNYGNANKVSVNANSLSVLNTGKISSSTWSHGEAGDVVVNVERLLINGADTGLFASAKNNSSGQVGNILVTADKAIYLTNDGKISIQNDATASDPSSIKTGAITISAPDIDLKNSSITTASTGNIDAGDVNINFSHWLTMDPSFIETTANTGNGGDININGGQLIYLQDSGFLTSVADANGNGGNINVAADLLVMNTGVIQANAQGGSGGDINLNLKALIPSQNLLIKGGARVDWQPFIPGFNVIQAASATGVSGNINLTSPQFDISGSLSGLNSSSLDLPIMNNPCQNEIGSSLVRSSQGGVPLNDENSSFFPAAVMPQSQQTKSETKIIQPTNPISSGKQPRQSCMAI